MVEVVQVEHLQVDARRARAGEPTDRVDDLRWRAGEPVRRSSSASRPDRVRAGGDLGLVPTARTATWAVDSRERRARARARLRTRPNWAAVSSSEANGMLNSAANGAASARRAARPVAPDDDRRRRLDGLGRRRESPRR